MRESTSFHISEEKYMTRISFDWTSRPPVWQLIYVCILGLSALIIWYQYVARPPPYLRMFSSWKMVTINTTDLNSAPTKTAVFIKFLIKIAFLPFSLDAVWPSCSRWFFPMGSITSTSSWSGIEICPSQHMEGKLSSPTLEQLVEAMLQYWDTSCHWIFSIRHFWCLRYSHC